MARRLLGASVAVSAYRFQLVLQFATADADAFEALIAAEDALIAALESGDAQVDGHDFGSGEMNIFIDTNTPQVTFAACLRVLAPGGLPLAAAGYRPFESDAYVRLWPHEAGLPFRVQ